MTRTPSLLSHLPSRGLLCAALLGALFPACKKDDAAKPAAPEQLGRASQDVRAPLADVDIYGNSAGYAADLFLGQFLPNTNGLNYAEARSLYNPGQMALDTSVSPPRLYLADTLNNRVLIWADATAYSTGTPADRVIGFPTFDQGSDYGQSHGCRKDPTASSLCRPAGIVLDPAGNLYVADTDNHRVVEFDAPFTSDTVADRVFGQTGPDTRSCNASTSATALPTEKTLCSPVSVDLDEDGNLYVADRGNSRVVRYDSPLTSDNAADFVLGQAGFLTKDPGFPEAQGLRGPTRLAVDRSATPNRLWVVDTANNRVLGYTTTAYANGAAPTKVLGQGNSFTAVLANGGATAPSNVRLKGPTGVAVDASGNVFVADTGNHRVLAFANPFTADTTADKVWGQTSMTAATSGSSATGMSSPSDVHVSAAGDLFVADSGNNRVLRFAGPLIGNTDITADQVWGQLPDFSTKACNQSGRASAETLCNPRAVTTNAAGDLFVADYGNNRVLRFAAPLDSAADQVYGQGSMDVALCNHNGLSASTLCSPSSVAVTADGILWVGDSNNNRVVAYKSTPSDSVADAVLGRENLTAGECTLTSATCYEESNVAVAVDAAGNLFVSLEQQNRVLRYDNPLVEGNDALPEAVLGQTDFTSRARNYPDDKTLEVPVSLAVDRSVTPNRLYVVDQGLHRIAVWHSVAFASGASADDWLGQPDGLGGGRSEVASASSFYKPSGCAVDGAGNLYVADGENNRVLRFNLPFDPTNGIDLVADLVVGQPDFTSTACNGGATPSSSTLCKPSALLPSPDGQTLWVADQGNHRVLRYDGFPANTVANAALGQADMTHGSANIPDAMSIYEPEGVAIDRSVKPNRVFIADTQNSRVLGWKDLDALSSGASANLVIGQVDFSQVGCNNGGISASTLCEPSYVRVDGEGRLWVSDAKNHRVLMFNAPFGEDAVADLVLGQPDFASGTANQGSTGPSAGTLNTPRGVDVDASGNVWVADRGNNRVLMFPNPGPTGALATKVIGQADLTSGLCNQGNPLPNQGTLCEPMGLRVDTTVEPYHLWIADYSNDRVLRFEDPVSDQTPDQVVGAVGYTAAPVNGWSDSERGQVISSSKLINPVDVAIDWAGNLYVADEEPDRVIMFENPRVKDLSGDKQFGQVSMSRRACNQAAQTSAAFICGPAAIDFDEYGSLWLADRSNNRVSSFFANTVPSASHLAIAPTAPRTSDPLALTYDFVDPDVLPGRDMPPLDQENGTIIKWFRNGAEVPELQGAKTVPVERTTRDETWYATVQPKDGIQFGKVQTSPTVTVRNTPPVADGLDLLPEAPKTGTPLTATYNFADGDQDPTNGTVLSWYRNNVKVTALENQLEVPGSYTQKNDVWYFEVVPHDGTDSGSLARSRYIQVANTLPTAASPAIFPATPRVSDSLTALYSYQDVDNDAPLAPRVRWYRNDLLQSQLDDLITVPGPFHGGERWYFTLEPRDGLTSYGALVTSLEVVIGNTPPVATNPVIEPASPFTVEDLHARYDYADAESDPQQGTEIRWFKNGFEQVDYAGLAVLPAAATQKRDVWFYRVTPKDGKDLGDTETSAPVFIKNSPPVADAGAAQSKTATGELTRVTVDASLSSDADGDLLAYTWRLAPDLAIVATSKTAEVSLPVGVHTLILSVNDGEDTNTDELTVTIGDPAPTVGVPSDFQAAPGWVELRGSATDLLSRALTYEWTQASGAEVVLEGKDSATARFFALGSGQRTFQLKVSAAGSQTPPATKAVSVFTEDLAPVARVPARMTVRINEVAELEAPGSTDPNGQALTFQWSVNGQPGTFTLESQDQPVAKFTALTDGVFDVQVVVNDGTKSSPAATLEVLALNPSVAHAPVADAGPDGSGEAGVAFSVDGTRSFDPDGDALTYLWEVSGLEGTLSSADTATPSFLPKAAGTATFKLTVTDSKGLRSEPDTVEFVVLDTRVNGRPVARVVEQTGAVKVQDVVLLDGSRSQDPDGDPLTFQWTQLDESVPAQVDEASKSTSSLKFAVTRPGLLAFQLVVTDDKGVASAPVKVRLFATEGTNTLPVADAGDDRIVLIGETVQLNGSGSSDADPNTTLRYVWEQVLGSPVVLSGEPATPTFTPPGGGLYRFRLTVSDGQASSAPDEVEFLAGTHGIDNKAPQAVVVGTLSANVGEEVVLDGSASQDADPLDQPQLSYRWTVVGFPSRAEPALSDARASKARFVPTAAGVYSFALVVSDGDLESAPAYLKVEVSGGEAPAGCSSAGAGPQLWLLGLGLVLALGLGRKRRSLVG